MIWTRHRKDVLRGIYQLENGKGSLRVLDLAYALNFNRSAVDRTLLYLQEHGYAVISKIDRVVYVACTDLGRSYAMCCCKRVRTRDYTQRPVEKQWHPRTQDKRPGLKISVERYLRLMEGVDYSKDNVTREILYGQIPHRQLAHSGCGSSLGGE